MPFDPEPRTCDHPGCERVHTPPSVQEDPRDPRLYYCDDHVHEYSGAQRAEEHMRQAELSMREARIRDYWNRQG